MLKKAKPYLISIAIALGVGLLSSFFYQRRYDQV